MINGSLFLGGGAAFSQPSPEIVQMICDFFQREITELESMVNRDLSA